MSRNESVDALRKKIDQIDEKVIALLNDRASLAQQIGHTKSLANQEIYAPHREKEILRRISQLSHGPLSQQALHSIFREVISASRSLEEPLKVAYLGPKATFTHVAAKEKFGSSATLVPAASIAEVFREVGQGRTAFGVVPIENSIEGAVAHTLDLLVESDVKICDEFSLNIHHCLLSRSGRAQDVQRIVSHPQALAQCRGWLTSHFADGKLEEVASTAQAALMAAADPTLAAVSSRLAQEVYNLEVVAANIEDHSYNFTRFLVIGVTETKRSGADKTSLVFSVKDQPGILHRMLQPFAKSRINLTKIESRPLKNKPWQYMFFIDFNGHKDDGRVKKVIKELEKNSLFIKILGSYPSGA